MWFVLGALLFITALLLLPVFVIITSDPSGKPIVSFKLLFIPLKKKQASSRKAQKTEKPKKEIKEKVFKENLLKNMALLTDIFKQILRFSKKCTVKRMEFDFTYSSKDAAETAVNYGICCTAIYNMFGFLNSVMKVKEKGRKINLNCDFEQEKVSIKYSFVISVKICSILATALGVLISFINKTHKNKG